MSLPSKDGDVLQTLSRRRNVLAALDGSPRDKRDLVDALDVSRSTVDRAIRELELFGFVGRRDGNYRLTVSGRLALAEHRRVSTALGAIDDVSGLLKHVPCDAPMSVDLLQEATVYEPEPHAPNQPFESMAELVEEADRFYGLAGAERVPHFRNRLYERTVNGTLDAEAVFTEELAEFLLEDRPEEIREVVELGGFGLYACPSIPYGLGIVETPSTSLVFVVVYGDAAESHGIIYNDTPAALEWADGVYRQYRAAATKLEFPK